MTQLDQYNDILTIDDTCEVLRIGRGQCYSQLRSGHIKAWKIGKTWKIPKAGIVEYIRTGGYAVKR